MRIGVVPNLSFLVVDRFGFFEKLDFFIPDYLVTVRPYQGFYIFVGDKTFISRSDFPLREICGLGNCRAELLFGWVWAFTMGFFRNGPVSLCIKIIKISDMEERVLL